MSECSICRIDFDIEEEGVIGSIGIIPVQLCMLCKNGMSDFAEQTLGLVTMQQAIDILDEEHERRI